MAVAVAVALAMAVAVAMAMALAVTTGVGRVRGYPSIQRRPSAFTTVFTEQTAHI